MSAFLSFLFLFASALFLLKRGLRYLQFFQQEGYRENRFLDWYRRELAFDRRGSLTVGVGIILAVFLHSSVTVRVFIFLVMTSVVGFIGMQEPDPRFAGKLPLRMTDRVQRILVVYCLITLFLLVLLYFLILSFGISVVFLFCAVLLFQLPPFLLIAANRALGPVEKRIQQRFYGDAQRLLKRIAPYTIGITGSYGKTSTKHILGHVLSTALSPTFFPEKGVNTVMGITREIREKLKPFHRFAVIEMGAYHVGSIKRLCDFTPPQAAIVTAVGLMHLDRFEGEENIYRAKSELPQAVPNTGLLVCNGDNPGARRMATDYKKQETFLYGLDPKIGPLDCSASSIVPTEQGTQCTVHWRDSSYEVLLPLFGEAAVSNALAAFTMACALGADPELVVASLRSVPQIENRLAVKKSGKITFLQDAYNSNPQGFEAALDVLGRFPGRHILVTPGMVELGERQVVENEKVAEKAAKVCDIVFIVGILNREPLRRGLMNGGMKSESIHCFNSRTEAFSHLNKIQQDGDTILIENDLPDILESKERF